MLKVDTLLKNKNNADRKIWIQLPTTVEKIQEAISDICDKKGDSYIVCKEESDINISLSKHNDIFKINEEVQNIIKDIFGISNISGKTKLSSEERTISEKKQRDRMKISNMVKRKPEIEKYCCICGTEKTEILHNKYPNDPYMITFICKECRADKEKLAQAEKTRFDIREIMDKSKMSTKTFTEIDVKNIVENYLFETVCIQDYCYKIGISRHKFNKLIEKYAELYDNPAIRKMVINHSNKINAKKLSLLALERYRNKKI